MSREPSHRLEDILEAAHCYFRTEDAIVWDAAKNHTPSLVAAVRNLLG
jgi:uncharacterized protein with HEPN domain